jgi:hypothetical protein
MTASTANFEFEALFDRYRRHLMAGLCAFLFVWLWPYQAVRDTFLPGDQRLTTAIIQVAAWLTVGVCIIVGRARRARPSGFMAAAFLVFISIYYVQFFLLGAPAAADQYNYAYAALSCIAPFVVGWYFPIANRARFCGWLAFFAVALTVFLTILNLTIYPVGSANRNWFFPSFNPINQAAVIAVGILALIYYHPPKALSVTRLILLILAAGQLLLTASRGPIIGVLVALVVSEALPAKSHRKRLWTLGVLACLVGGAFLFKDYLPEMVVTRVFDVDQSVNMTGNAGGAGVRVGPILLAIQLGTTKPLLGWGESANPIIGFYCHNFFAQAFLETGLIGLTGVALLIITGAIRLARGARQATGEGRFIFAVFILFLTVNQFAFTPVYAVQLWFTLGLAASSVAASTRLRPGRATGAPVWGAPDALPVSSQHPTEQGVRIR